MSTTELTSAERDALARLEKATGGPVIVLDVTSEPAGPGKACRCNGCRFCDPCCCTNTPAAKGL